MVLLAAWRRHNTETSHIARAMPAGNALQLRVLGAHSQTAAAAAVDTAVDVEDLAVSVQMPNVADHLHDATKTAPGSCTSRTTGAICCCA